MIKKLFAAISVMLISSILSYAGQEMDINLDYENCPGMLCNAGNALVSFTMKEYSPKNSTVEVTIENIRSNQVIFLFANDMSEMELKRGHKIFFEKTYGGSKGMRSVAGCKVVDGVIAIRPQEKTVFLIDVPNEQVFDLSLPLYIANRGIKVWEGFRLGQKIKLSMEDMYKFKVTTNVWREDDPAYLAAVKASDDLIQSLSGVKFCAHKAHKPSLEDQQKPYIEKKDSLMDVLVYEIGRWRPDQKAYKAYVKILEKVAAIGMAAYTVDDCGKHVESKTHKCSWCSLSYEQLFHKMDDLYQRLYVGGVEKGEAVSAAKSYYRCVQENKKRRKNATYSKKIKEYYDRIMEF